MKNIIKYLIILALIKVFLFHGDDFLKFFIKQYFKAPVTVVKNHGYFDTDK